MLAPIAAAAAIITGDWTFPLVIGFYLLIFAARALFLFAFIFGIPVAAFFLVWLGYNKLVKNRPKTENKQPVPDSQETAQSQT